MFKNSKIFSALRFHIKVFENRDKALDELEENKDFVFFTPIVTSFATFIITLLLSPFVPATVSTVLALSSFVTIFYHLAIMIPFSSKLERRKHLRERKEKERIRREKEKELHHRMWREKLKRQYEEEYEELFRRQREQDRQKQQQHQHRYGGYSNDTNKQSNIDQNMINAIRLLGLSNGFLQKDVKSAYRKLSKIHHPDVGGSEVNFKKLNTAYNYIIDRI